MKALRRRSAPDSRPRRRPRARCCIKSLLRLYEGSTKEERARLEAEEEAARQVQKSVLYSSMRVKSFYRSFYEREREHL
jgi:hypothetical protein